MAARCRARSRRRCPLVGFLSSRSPDEFCISPAAFRTGLQTGGGYVEGQNVAIEYRWAEGQYDRLPELAADLVRRGVAVLVNNWWRTLCIFPPRGDIHYSDRFHCRRRPR